MAQQAFEFEVSYRTDDDEAEDVSLDCRSLDHAKSTARRLSVKHSYAVAARYRINPNDDDIAYRSLDCESVYVRGRLDVTNDLALAA